MSNFVKIGEFEVTRRGADVGRSFRPVESVEAVIVGVRTDTGKLTLQLKRTDRNYALPPLSDSEARHLAELLIRGADMAGGLQNAYETYQAALRQAEDALNAALAVDRK